jgi:hypothetical protein
MKPPSLARYFFAITSPRQGFHTESERLIAAKFGSLGIRSEIINFSEFSTYYDQELGGTCWKYLVSLENLFAVDQIVQIKQFTEEVEASLAREDEGTVRRRVNIDPGYLNGWQVVLASVKIHSHRLYLNHGIYGELTLLYQEKKFRPLPWTYRDYQSPAFLEFLTRLRNEYSEQLRNSPHPVE